jgi:hypothetical protein
MQNSFGGHVLNKMLDCFLTLNDFFNELESKISDVPSDIMEPRSYSESVFFTCGRRFSVVIKHVLFSLSQGKNY